MSPATIVVGEDDAKTAAMLRLYVTARAEEDERLRGLAWGADRRALPARGTRSG